MNNRELQEHIRDASVEDLGTITNLHKSELWSFLFSGNQAQRDNIDREIEDYQVSRLPEGPELDEVLTQLGILSEDSEVLIDGFQNIRALLNPNGDEGRFLTALRKVYQLSLVAPQDIEPAPVDVLLNVLTGIFENCPEENALAYLDSQDLFDQFYKALVQECSNLFKDLFLDDEGNLGDYLSSLARLHLANAGKEINLNLVAEVWPAIQEDLNRYAEKLGLPWFTTMFSDIEAVQTKMSTLQLGVEEDFQEMLDVVKCQGILTRNPQLSTQKVMEQGRRTFGYEMEVEAGPIEGYRVHAQAGRFPDVRQASSQATAFLEYCARFYHEINRGLQADASETTQVFQGAFQYKLLGYFLREYQAIDVNQPVTEQLRELYTAQGCQLISAYLVAHAINHDPLKIYIRFSDMGHLQLALVAPNPVEVTLELIKYAIDVKASDSVIRTLMEKAPTNVLAGNVDNGRNILQYAIDVSASAVVINALIQTMPIQILAGAGNNDIDGRNILQYACMKRASESVISELARRLADFIALQDHQKLTSLDYALQYGYSEGIVSLFIAKMVAKNQITDGKPGIALQAYQTAIEVYHEDGRFADSSAILKHILGKFPKGMLDPKILLQAVEAGLEKQYLIVLLQEKGLWQDISVLNLLHYAIQNSLDHQLVIELIDWMTPDEFKAQQYNLLLMVLREYNKPADNRKAEDTFDADTKVIDAVWDRIEDRRTLENHCRDWWSQKSFLSFTPNAIEILLKKKSHPILFVLYNGLEEGQKEGGEHIPQSVIQNLVGALTEEALIFHGDGHSLVEQAVRCQASVRLVKQLLERGMNIGLEKQRKHYESDEEMFTAIQQKGGFERKLSNKVLDEFRLWSWGAYLPVSFLNNEGKTNIVRLSDGVCNVIFENRGILHLAIAAKVGIALFKELCIEFQGHDTLHKDSSHRTPLLYAIKCKNEYVTGYLAQEGSITEICDLDISSGEKAPYELAEAAGFDNTIVQKLRQKYYSPWGRLCRYIQCDLPNRNVLGTDWTVDEQTLTTLSSKALRGIDQAKRVQIAKNSLPTQMPPKYWRAIMAM